MVGMGARRARGVLFLLSCMSVLFLLLLTFSFPKLFFFKGDAKFGFEAVDKGGDVVFAHVAIADKGSHVGVEMEGGKIVDADGLGCVAACDGKLAIGIVTVVHSYWVHCSKTKERCLGREGTTMRLKRASMSSHSFLVGIMAAVRARRARYVFCCIGCATLASIYWQL